MKRIVVWLAFVAAAGLALAQDVSQERVIELPKFVVTDNRELPPPESWRYATIPGFEILSNASDRATQRLLRDFDMFRQALSYVWPVPTRITQTTSLILCGRGGKFDAFVPKEKYDAEKAKASLFLKDEKTKTHAAIIIDLQATTLNVLNVDGADDAATGTDSGVISVEHDKQLYREYVRFLMSQSEPRTPPWLEEGLSQIIMKMQFDKRWIEFAKLEEPNTISAQAANVLALNALGGGGDDAGGGDMALPGAPAEDRDFAAALRRKALVPMDKFFAVTHDSPEATNPLGNNRWAKQAYAFVHMCLYGRNGKFQKPFMTFLQRSAREPVTEAMFKECFRFPKGKGKDGQETFREMSYNDMLMEIRGYCDFTDYKSQLIQPKKRSDPDLITVPKPLVFRDATQSEVGRIKGEALVMGGHIKEARAELIAPYIRGERDPDLLAELGMYERAYGEPDRARKFLEHAVTNNTKRGDALIELARLRYADAVAKPAGPDGRLSAAQVASITGPLAAARKQPPPMLALYELAGDTWLRAADKPKRDDAMMLIEGAQLFPTRMKLVYQAAVLSADAGELQAARALADHGIKYGPDANVKKRFEEFKTSLPPAPAPTAATATTKADAKPETSKAN